MASTPWLKFMQSLIFSRNKQRIGSWQLNSFVQEELDVIPVQSEDSKDKQEGVVVSQVENEGTELSTQVSGFGSSEGQLSFEGFSSASTSAIEDDGERRLMELEMDRLMDRTINGMIVLAAGSYAITKLLTIDHDYWHGWTIYEILGYAPQHNWSAYEEALKTNLVLAKMAISGVVYSLGDWIAQCFEGKPLFEFDRVQMFRSGLVGFTLHGSLSHYYYQFCEELFPFHDWWVVPVKVAFDQTAWAALWNSIYYIVLEFLRLEYILAYAHRWKLWPFAHLITYGVIPVEQRLLWVDCVELIWLISPYLCVLKHSFMGFLVVCLHCFLINYGLETWSALTPFLLRPRYSNEKSEARISETAEASSYSLPNNTVEE